MNESTVYEYGAMSSKFSLQAKNKLIAYATMVIHYNTSAHLLVIFSPIECKKDCWASFDGKISEKLHNIFGGKPEDFPKNDAFDKFVESNIKEIKECYKSIKRVV